MNYLLDRCCVVSSTHTDGGNVFKEISIINLFLFLKFYPVVTHEDTRCVQSLFKSIIYLCAMSEACLPPVIKFKFGNR